MVLFIRKYLRKLGFDFHRIRKINVLDALVYRFYYEDFFFIQIGANNGKRSDPIHNLVSELKLKGIVIEPIKDYFIDLQKNYSKSSQVLPLNYAVYERDGALIMYKHILNTSEPEWTQGIASIDKEHYKKSGVDKKNIIEEEVNSITYDTLFKNYNIKIIDLLIIDTEGYDYNLLKMFPFNIFKPKIIQFEHGIIDKIMSKDQLNEIINILLSLDYKIITLDYDCLAYL